MNKKYIYALLLVILIALTAISGVYIGEHCFHRMSQQMDQDLHKHLDITPEQEIKLAKIEESYQMQLKYLEEKLRLTKMELANAVKEEKKLGPRMEKAINDNHTLLGEVQKLIMRHLFDMQTILSAEQNEKMNSVIVDALYHQH